MSSFERRTAVQGFRCGSILEQLASRKAGATALFLATALAGGPTVWAQDVQNAANASGPVALEELVVTGSRIARPDGFEAPTPVMVLGVEEMKASPGANLAE